MQPLPHLHLLRRLGSFILLPTLLLFLFFYTLAPPAVSTASDEGEETTAVFAPPIANDDTYTSTEDEFNFVLAPGFLINDSHPDLEVFTPTLIAPPSNGVLQFNEDGSFLYSPSPNFEGTDSFVYQIYDGLPLAPLAYLPFDDGNNPTADITGNGHDGTLVNGPTFTTTIPITLGTGSALLFDGLDDTVNLTGTVDLANQSFTVAFWAKRNSIGGYDIATGQDTGGANNALHIGFRDSNVFTCAFWNNDLDTPTAYTDLEWHHWACVFDAPSKQRLIYRDGVMVASDTASANYQGDGTFTIGSRQGADPFDGLIDDVRIYNQPLAPSEITDAMLGNPPGTGEADTAVVTLNVTAVNDAPLAADDFYTTTQNIPFHPPMVEGNLTTLFTSGNSHDGNMFNVTALNSTLTLHAFDLNIDSTGLREVIVYYKEGTLVGSEQTPANWTLLGTFMVDAQGTNNPTFLDIRSAGGITIPAGEEYGVYLSVTDTALNLRYTNGTTTYSDDYLSISSGTGNAYPFGSFFSSRNWNGRIYYERDLGVLANDNDVDNVNLTAVLENGPSFGALSINPNGGFIYTPTVSFAGIDTFTYIASDGTLTDTATTTIYVTAVPCLVETTGDDLTDYASSDASAVQQAINNASPGDWLKIAGTCAGVQNTLGISQTVYLTQSVTLAGGYTATNWLAAPDPTAHPTLLDAQGEGHVVNVTAGLTPTLLNLTLTGGADTAVRISPATTMTISHTQFISNSGVEGSAIWNDGHLTIYNSTFSGNQASVDGTIHNRHHLTITGSAFHSNTAERGGAVYNADTGTFVLHNSTLANNQAGEGGAIHSRGIMTITHSTLAGNTANVGAGIHTWGGSSVFALFNNIIAANNTGSQCFNDGATLQNSLNNIIPDGSCGATLTADPLLAPLGDNGGPTWTMLPQAFSPAIDFIPTGNIGCGTLYTADQRNLPRPIDGACDIGAVEIQTNFAPTVVAETYTTTEDIPLIVSSASGVLSNDSDWRPTDAPPNGTIGLPPADDDHGPF
ncbi:MAG: tandem-95 repeat protein [Chloroflexi bacterium]|nr:tandem-95 repeat protein [Chloroflexota bacterium]